MLRGRRLRLYISEQYCGGPMSSDRRDRLIRAARRLFVERGFRAAGIDSILELAGVAKMTLYNHFGSKDSLMREVLNHHDVEARGAYLRRMQAAKGGPRDAVMTAFDQLDDELASASFDGGLFLRAAYEFAAERDVYRVAAAEHRARMAGVFIPYLIEMGAESPTEVAGVLAMLIDAARASAFACGDETAAKKARGLAELVLAKV